MIKRTLATLCALLAFMAVLAVVPLVGAEPAQAHPKTKQRCDFDPLSGLSFNCRTVPVAHAHVHPARLPDPRPPATAQPRCRPWPNCQSTPTTAPPTTTDPSDQKNINNARDRNNNGGGHPGGTDEESDDGGGDSTDPSDHKNIDNARDRNDNNGGGHPGGTDDESDGGGGDSTDPSDQKNIDNARDRNDNNNGGGGDSTEPGTRPSTQPSTQPSTEPDTQPTTNSDGSADGDSTEPEDTGTRTDSTGTTTATQPRCPSGEHRNGDGCHPDHEPPCGVGVWDPGHGHEIVLRQACASSDATHAIGPITYCGTQSHTHTTHHFHYGADGCHAVADLHPEDPTRYTGPNACTNWQADVNKAIQSSSSTYPQPPTGQGCGTLGTHLKNLLGHVERGVDVFVDHIKAELEALVEDLETLNDARLRGLIELQKLYNNLSDEQQIVLDVLICAGPTALGASAGSALGPGGAVAGGLVLAAHCALEINEFSKADYEGQLSENRHQSEDDDSDGDDADSGDDGDSESDSGDDSQGSDDGDSGTDDSDGPSLEGSWEEVLRRNAPKNADDRHVLYRQYMCSRYGFDFFCASP